MRYRRFAASTTFRMPRFTPGERSSGMETEDLRRLNQLKAENRKLKRLLADSMLDADALRAALSKKTDPMRQAQGDCGDAG